MSVGIFAIGNIAGPRRGRAPWPVSDRIRRFSTASRSSSSTYWRCPWRSGASSRTSQWLRPLVVVIGLADAYHDGSSVKSAKSKPGTTTQLTRVGSSPRGQARCQCPGGMRSCGRCPAPMSWPITCLVAVDFSVSHVHRQWAAAMEEPQLGAGHAVPSGVLVWHQQEQDRGAGAAWAVVFGWQRGLTECQCTTPSFAEPAALGVGG